MGRVMQETLLSWQLNGQPQPALLCSPGMEEALLRGHLITGRIVDEQQEIRAITANDAGWQVETAAGRAPGDLPARLAETPVCKSKKRAQLSQLLRLSERLMEWNNAQGQHAVLLTDGEKEALGCDIGRHNALDKAVGAGIEAGLRLEDAVMCTSGRLSVEILAKAAAAGIPILCTKKQVGDLACQWADRLGIAIVQAGPAPQVYGKADRVNQEETL